MAVKIFYDSDANPAALRGKTIAVVGYGSQGHAQAQNLRDSGHRVLIGLEPGRKSAAKAREDGFTVLPVAEAAGQADWIHILLPDETHAAVYQASIQPHLTKGKVLGVSHGFSLHFKTIVPPADVDVVMIAPKSPGHLVRRVFAAGGGVPSLIAVAQDASGRARELALAFAAGIGSTRAGVLETTFKEETETDLFGEQAVLCGGMTALIKAGFDTLVAAGYQPEIAYFECLHETKLIVDLIYEGGLARMRDSVSNTAEYGDLTQGPNVIGEQSKQAMKKILQRVQDGSFAREWIAENQAGGANFKRLRAAENDLLIEKVGARLRGMMSWLKPAGASGRGATAGGGAGKAAEGVAESVAARG